MDSSFLKQLRKGLLWALPVLGLFIVILAMTFPTASNQGYSPAQPLTFSHKIHAGVNKIPCQYCHSGVETSRHALIPSTGSCMNCHSMVKLDSPLVQELRKIYAEGKNPPWVRVHELADYVYFPHKRHIAKNIACETCHGDVKNMDQIKQVKALTMGWCMECHRGITTPPHVLALAPPRGAPH